MDLVAMWSLAETGYSLTTMAAVAVSWCIWQRAPRGRETALLCGSVLTLGLHYACLAADAFVQARHVRVPRVTPWAAFGHVALILSGTLCVAFLLVVLTRLYAPARPTRGLVWAVIGHVGLAGVLALSMGGRLAVALLDGSSPDLVERRVSAIVGGVGGGLTALCFTSPVAFLGMLFERRPTRGGARWTRWLIGGARRRTSASPGPISSTGTVNLVRTAHTSPGGRHLSLL